MLSHEDHTKTSNYVDIIILFVLFPFRQYRDYKQCIRPLMSGCRKGVQKVLDYDGRLRTYTMKMDYICKDAKTGEYTNYGRSQRAHSCPRRPQSAHSCSGRPW